MSGIFGLFNLNKTPVLDNEIQQMEYLLTRRGPDRTGSWTDNSIGLGHALLATTPEALHEHLPLVSPKSGCVITADARLDNRPELLERLGLPPNVSSIGDAELILAAYHAWGTSCVNHLLGDFAFAIWDPRKHRLFCARDHFGIRPFYYHFTKNHFFVFASEPRAILVLPQVPYQINEGRIADFLITQLEGIDKTSTFFEEVYRLQPAHSLIITPEGMHKEQYWTLEPGPELKLSSNEEYAEAFLDVFTKAVRRRLRGSNTVGSMLSGGMDSGSVVAVARDILARDGQGPLSTFSAISSTELETCVETQTIQSAMTMNGLNPHVVDLAQLDGLQPKFKELALGIDEPFDFSMNMVRAVYLSANMLGIKAVLDGIDGDLVLSEGTYIARLLRQGRWLTAYRETTGQKHFWGEGYPVWGQLFSWSRQAFIPDAVKQLYLKIQPLESRNQVNNNIQKSLICPDFASRVRLAERLQALAAHRPTKQSPGLGVDNALAINHPNLITGVERYNRVASAIAIEPRHPFLDRRFVMFCLTLPGSQKLNHGWRKAILRRAMAGKLPDAVRWRRGKKNLGWQFTQALMKSRHSQMKLDIDINTELLSRYLNIHKIGTISNAYFDGSNLNQAESVFQMAQLAVWLQHHANRPKSESGT